MAQNPSPAGFGAQPPSGGFGGLAQQASPPGGGFGSFGAAPAFGSSPQAPSFGSTGAGFGGNTGNGNIG